MADQEEDGAEKEDLPEGEKKKSGSSKGPAKMVGGIAIVLALGAGAAMMAIPSKSSNPRMAGPYSYDIVTKENKISANVLDNNQSRYLQVNITCEYFAYDQLYLDTRVTDPLYVSTLRSEVGNLIAQKRLAETMVGEASEAFREELHELLDPILFPIHIGETSLPLSLDEDSGLRPGVSYHKATFRGRFHDSVLTVDAIEKTLQLNGGTVVSFDGSEEDFKIITPDGETIYIDVTELKPDFQGDLKIGTRGRMRRLYLVDKIAQ